MSEDEARDGSLEEVWQMLLALPSGETLSLPLAAQLMDALARRMAQLLATDVQVKPEWMTVDHGSISGVVQSRQPLGGAITVAWRALVFISVLADDRVSVSANLFLFAAGKRVVSPGLGDFLALDLDPYEGPEAHWKFIGWAEDEFDEWRGFLDLKDDGADSG